MINQQEQQEQKQKTAETKALTAATTTITITIAAAAEVTTAASTTTSVACYTKCPHLSALLLRVSHFKVLACLGGALLVPVRLGKVLEGRLQLPVGLQHQLPLLLSCKVRHATGSRLVAAKRIRSLCQVIILKIVELYSVFSPFM